MQIGLDYDDTYTRDPEAWNQFVQMFVARGHSVFVVTWRTPEECDDLDESLVNIVEGVYATSRKAKEKYMFAQGIRIDVWIDDNPWAVTHAMEGWE